MALGKWWFISEPRANSQINPSHQKTSAFFQHHQVALGAEKRGHYFRVWRDSARSYGITWSARWWTAGVVLIWLCHMQVTKMFLCWQVCTWIQQCLCPFLFACLGPRFGFRGVSVLCIMRISTSHCSDFRDARILNLAETRWNALLGQMGQLAVDLEGLEPGITLKDHWWVHCTARHSKAFVGHDVFRGPGPRYEGTTAQQRKKKMGRFQNRHPIFRRRFWPPTHIGFWMFREHITIFLWQVERHPVL